MQHLRRGVATGGGGGHKFSVPPGVPHKKKSCIHIFLFANIARGKYFAPHKNHAYAFLKYALKCLFLNGCSSPSILKEIALLLCKNANIF